MNITIPNNVKAILGRVSQSSAPYAGVAREMLVSLSNTKTDLIQLPAQVMDLMDRGILRNRQAYSQSDLLEIMEEVSTVLGNNLMASEVKSDEEYDDFDLTSSIAAHRSGFLALTNAQLKDVSPSRYATKSRMERYAIALAYLDAMADRQLSATSEWIDIVSNHLNFNLGD